MQIMVLPADLTDLSKKHSQGKGAEITFYRDRFKISDSQDGHTSYIQTFYKKI